MQNGPYATVLLIDDDDFARAGLRTYLESQGLAVSEARDVARAREVFKRNPTALAVVDLSLPLQAGQDEPAAANGWELVRFIKARAPTTGVVVLSAFDHYLDEFKDLLRRGTRGLAYKLKGRRTRDLLTTLYLTLDGHVAIDPEVRPKILSPLVQQLRQQLTEEERPWVEVALENFGKLSGQELRAAYLLAAAHNSEGLARRMGIQRADTLISRVYLRLGLDGVARGESKLRQIVLLVKACQIHNLQVPS